MSRFPTGFATLPMVVSFLGIAACGDGDKGGTVTSPNAKGTPTATAASEEPILIKTHVAPLTANGETVGKVVSGSTIGGSAFCAGGKFRDGPVTSGDRLVLRVFRCPGGTLAISFTSTPPGTEQRSAWKIVNGKGRFAGLTGGGRMSAALGSARGEDRETFNGTVTR
jgi:hypothetical protein